PAVAAIPVFKNLLRPACCGSPFFRPNMVRLRLLFQRGGQCSRAVEDPIAMSGRDTAHKNGLNSASQGQNLSIVICRQSFGLALPQAGSREATRRNSKISEGSWRRVGSP